MTFQEALSVLKERQETRIELGLSRVRSHLKLLGDPQEYAPAFHVAGTNGKGSVCAILDSVLRQAGYKTGFYSSPHLLDPRERIKIDGEPINGKDFARHLKSALEADPKGSLTYFELMTNVAFQHFKESRIEVAVLETGLGGRLDATNVIRSPSASLITSIHFDHAQFLGKSLGRIAFEKAGIIKAGRPVICAELAPEPLAVIRVRARRMGSPLTVVRPWRPVASYWRRNRQVLRDPRGRDWTLGLLGAGQASNAALAWRALRSAKGRFPVSDQAWRRGLLRVNWPGRFEVRAARGKTAILDGAHNPQAMECFERTWSLSPWNGKDALWILGVMKDKDLDGILRPIARHLREVVAVRPRSPRALAPEALAQKVRLHAPRARVRVEPRPEAAVEDWLSDPSPNPAVVCGSFYLVAEVRRCLEAEKS
ncbi:MAG: bifunctional folylpolyglutamate synthase/dihydrofolate synthase [Elusimicrobia bacterium]|nr:bifunctional folylpolyglutamate synthase/dihydrofolate synthase [Elusimicrobiota bacterium]